MENVAKLIKEANSVVIFTGAGMSTESGLPDFRSKDRGLWQKFNPDELANVNALINNEAEFTKFYQYRLGEISKYTPHQGHKILAKWEELDIIDSIITQNVDAFHSDAGNQDVFELHGSFRDMHCHECHNQVSRETYLAGESTCECGGTIRPGIVLFGESLPQDTFRLAEERTKKADLFIVLGSSLSVTPANMFPMVAKENGAKLIIVNREPTELDALADQTIHDMNIKQFLIELDHSL